MNVVRGQETKKLLIGYNAKQIFRQSHSARDYNMSPGPWKGYALEIRGTNQIFQSLKHSLE